MVSFLEKYAYLAKVFQMTKSGTRVGLHLEKERDGLMHDLGHFVCLGGDVDSLKRDRASATPFLENRVTYLVDEYETLGGDPDRDECRTIAACVHAWRRVKYMKSSEMYIRSNLLLSKELARNPKGMRERTKKDVLTAASEKRGAKIHDLLTELYTHYHVKLGIVPVVDRVLP